MPVQGACKLCLKETELLRSHYMPNAVYPTKRHKSASITQGVIDPGPMFHVREHLLCKDCEKRLSENGEEPVFKWLAPKSKEFPLSNRMRLALPRDNHPTLPRYAADDIGLDLKPFAYFAVSMVWRGSIHRWTLRDGSLTTQLNLGIYQETIRQFLLGEIPFLTEIASLIFIVCSDSDSRSVWGLTSQNTEAGCENYRLVIRGLFFRLLLGPNIPQSLRDISCLSPRQCLFYGDCSEKIKRDFGPLISATQSLKKSR